MDPPQVFCHNPDCPASGKVDRGHRCKLMRYEPNTRGALLGWPWQWLSRLACGLLVSLGVAVTVH